MLGNQNYEPKRKYFEKLSFVFENARIYFF